MTQLNAFDGTAKSKQAAEAARKGLFLVKASSASHTVPAAEPSMARRSRSLGLLALAAAALAAPLLWFLHEVLSKVR